MEFGVCQGRMCYRETWRTKNLMGSERWAGRPWDYRYPTPAACSFRETKFQRDCSLNMFVIRRLKMSIRNHCAVKQANKQASKQKRLEINDLSIHQPHSHVVAMCRILSRVAENLVYHYRLRDDDELDDIALNLGRYLNKGRK